MNDDINIYDGAQIEGSSEAKSRNTWVEMFDMIGMFLIFLVLKKCLKSILFSILLFSFHTTSFIYLQKFALKNQKKNTIKDCAIGNLQTQNKDLKRQVNELSSKLNKV